MKTALFAYINSEKILGWSLLITSSITVLIGAYLWYQNGVLQDLNRKSLVFHDNAGVSLAKISDARLLHRILTDKNLNLNDAPFDLQLARVAYAQYYLLVMKTSSNYPREELVERARIKSENEVHSMNDFIEKVNPDISNFVQKESKEMREKIDTEKYKEKIGFYILFLFQGLNLLIALRFNYITYKIKQGS